MLPKEIERKYTINYLPKNIIKIIRITQKHIYRDPICSIRVRKSLNTATNEAIYTHTINQLSLESKQIKQYLFKK